MARDADFSAATRRTLAEAACYLCTNPTCRRFTARPAADGAGSVVLGRAAHIHAASPKGPRYDPTQSHEERVSEANGIWLCSECAAAVDHKLDVRRYAAEELRNWKQRHHHWLKNDGHVPEVPRVSVQTVPLSLGPPFKTIDDKVLRIFREQRLVIENAAQTPLTTVRLAMVFPERVVHVSADNRPPETLIGAFAGQSDWRVTAVTAGSIEPLPGRGTYQPVIQMSALPPLERLEMRLITHAPMQLMMCDNPGEPMRPAPDPDVFADAMGNVLFHYGELSYQFSFRDERIPQSVVIPLRYSYAQRVVTSLPAERPSDRWHLNMWSEAPGVKFTG